MRGWVEERELTARYGCPFGTLASELDKRTDSLDRQAAKVMLLLIDWAEQQFQSTGPSSNFSPWGGPTPASSLWP